MIHLLKGSIGAGILAMPEAVSRLGLVSSAVGLLFIGFFATYCIQLLVLIIWNELVFISLTLFCPLVNWFCSKMITVFEPRPLTKNVSIKD